MDPDNAKMIGFIHLYNRESELIRQLSLYAYAKKVPFCHFSPDALDACMEGKPLVAKRWNGETMEEFETRLPMYVDRISSLGSPGAKRYFGADRISWLLSHTTVLTQLSFTKDQLMVAMLQNGLSEYVIPSYYITSFQEACGLLALICPALIKPVLGKQGKLVCKITKEDSCYYAEDQNGRHVFNEAFFAEYCEELRRTFGGKILFQPFLDFRYDNDHVVDFRLLRQRGADGSWEDVATYARIGSNAVTSNIHAGGSMLWADTALQVIAPDKAEALLEEIMMLGEKLPLLVEKYYGEDAFCIGFDIAIDRASLRPYVMESNLTPGFRFVQYQYADHRTEYYKYLLSK